MASSKPKKAADWKERIKQHFHFGARTPEINSESIKTSHSSVSQDNYAKSSDSRIIKALDDSKKAQQDTKLLSNPSDTPYVEQQDDQVPSWRGLKSLMRVLEATGSLFGPLKNVIAEIGTFIDLFDSITENRQDYCRLSAELDSLFSELRTLLEGPLNPTMTTSIKNLCSSLESEIKWIRSKKIKGTTRRYTEPIEDPNALMESYQRIHGYFARVTLNMNVGMWRTIDEQVTERRLDRLSPSLSAVYNSAESDEIDRGPCTPDTRTAELKKLVSWTNESPTNRKGVYWMNGMAGTGKTTIAYSLCTRLEEQGKLAASFFCSRLIPQCRNVKLIIPTLAYQLARFSHPFRSALAKALEIDPDAHTRSLKVQFESLILKPSLEVQNALPENLVVVVDALDECENEDSTGQILDTLISSDPRIPIRFLVSSRPEPEIYRRMAARHEDSDLRLVLHELDAERVQNDIEKYLRHELEGIPLTSAQFSGLVEKSGVLFIYASTAARYIKHGLAWSVHEERIDMILGLSAASDGYSHQAVDELYSTILNQALQNPKLDQSNRTWLKILLDTVICVQEPATTSTLAGLIGLKSSQQVEGLLRPLYSVLHIVNKTALVATIHASFPDFMLDSRRSGPLYCNPSLGHQRLTRACLDIIKNNSCQFNICGLTSSYLLDTQLSDFDNRVEASIPPKLFYACQHWEAHMELGAMDDLLESLLYDFLSSRLLLWVETLNAKKQLYNGVKILQKLDKWCQSRTGDNNLLELVHDAWWFVTTFANHPVSQSTPHLYISMLSFWPRSNPISRHYKRWAREAIEINGTAIERRYLSLLATWSFSGEVYRASLSRDGTQIVVGVDSKIFIVDSSTGQSIAGPLESSDALVHWVEFSPDDSRIASASQDGLRLWRVRGTNATLELFCDPTKPTNYLRFSCHGAHIASSSSDDKITLWDSNTGAETLEILTGHTGWIRAIDFFPDDTRLISGADDGSARVWDLQTGDLIVSHAIHSSLVMSISLSSDGSLAVSGCADCSMKLWDPISGETKVDFLEAHTNSVESVKFSPDNLRIASVSGDMTIRVWDPYTGQTVIGPLEGHTHTIHSVSFTPDGSRLVTCGEDSTVRVWDLNSPRKSTSQITEHTNWVQSACFSQNGTRIISGSIDSTIRTWGADEGKLLMPPLQAHSSGVYSLGIAHDDQRIISGSTDCEISIWDAQNGKLLLGPIEAHAGAVLSVAFSPDGSSFASSSDGEIALWKSRTGELLKSVREGLKGKIHSIRYSPDGSSLVSASSDHSICIWDAVELTKIKLLEGHTGSVTTASFSPDGLRIISGSEDFTLRLWDVQTGQAIGGPLIGHNDSVTSVAFSPNGEYIASCSDDFTIRIWDIKTMQTIMGPLQADPNYVKWVQFSPDGMRVVSSGADLALRVWDIQSTLQETETETGHNNWTMNDDGWVQGPRSEYLIWVPPDLRTSLLRPQNTLVISPRGWLKLDFDGASIGEDWTKIYESVG